MRVSQPSKRNFIEACTQTLFYNKVLKVGRCTAHGNELIVSDTV